MTRPLYWLWACGLLAACPGYNPEFVDCAVKCSEKGTCPAGRECKAGFCRPEKAQTSCECTGGDQRPCGGGLGACVAGIQTCNLSGSWGACVGEAKPTPELCDNKDNDCNGASDDLVTDAPPCPLTKGVCAASAQRCVAGSYSGSCAAGDYGPTYEQLETRCDGFDNDCDGVVDATAPKPLLAGVNNYVLAEYDGGFSLVAVEEPATGGYQVVLLRLDQALQARGPVVPVSPPALSRPQDLAARATPTGTTFVAWADTAVDAGVQLSAVDSNGIVSQFSSYAASEKAGTLSLGVNASTVFVSFPALYSTVGRLVMWDRGDGGVSTRDFFRPADGGVNPWNEIEAARLSPSGKVIGFYGWNTDAGTNYSLTTELQGTRSFDGGLGKRFEFTEVGNVVQTGWSYSQVGFSLPPFIDFPDESGFEFKPDVFTSTLGVLKKQTDLNITPGSIGRGLNSTVVVWTERNLVAVLGSPFGNGSQSRQRVVVTDGGYFGNVQLGHPGGTGALLGLVWRDTISGTGNLSGMMVCQP